MPNPSVARCCIARLDAGVLTPTATARPGDELVLLVELPPHPGIRILAVDLHRGADHRDTWEQPLVPAAEPAVRVFRLRWRDRPSASPRLTCRVRLDGRVIGTLTLLLAPAADAQGRFDTPSTGPMSEPTRLAFLDALGRLLDTPPDNPARRRVPPDDGG